jgi:hypothetical protein
MNFDEKITSASITANHNMFMSQMKSLLNNIPEHSKKDALVMWFGQRKVLLDAQLASVKKTFDGDLENLQKVESTISDIIKTFSEEMVKLNANSTDNSSKIEMLKVIMIWINASHANKIDNLSDDSLRKYLANVFKYNVDMSISLNDMISTINEKAIVKAFSGDVCTERLLFNEKNAPKSNHKVKIVFVGAKTTNYAVDSDDLLCSKKYRDYLYTRDRSVAFEVPLDASMKVAQAIVGLIERETNYSKHLETIEEWYHFVKVFQYLELKFV